MVTSCRKHGLLDPEFIDTGYDFRVVIRKNTSAGISRVISSLNTRQIAAFHFMVEKKPSISSGEYALLCDCTERTARTDLKAMMDLGVIIRTGKSKRAMYSISDRFRIVSGSFPEKSKTWGTLKPMHTGYFPNYYQNIKIQKRCPCPFPEKCRIMFS